MAYEYKTVGAPARLRLRGRHASGADALAVEMSAILREQSAAGWEYVRAELLPLTERPGFFARPHQVERAVLVFRRPLEEDPLPRF